MVLEENSVLLSRVEVRFLISEPKQTFTMELEPMPVKTLSDLQNRMAESMNHAHDLIQAAAKLEGRVESITVVHLSQAALNCANTMMCLSSLMKDHPEVVHQRPKAKGISVSGQEPNLPPTDDTDYSGT